MWLYHRVMSPNDADGMANSVDPDQTAPLGAVWSGSALFAQAYLSKNLGSLRYSLFRRNYFCLSPKSNIYWLLDMVSVYWAKLGLSNQSFILTSISFHFHFHIHSVKFSGGMFATNCRDLAAWQNQQNDLYAQWTLRPTWASAQSGQSLLCVLRVDKDPRFLHANSEDFDQTGHPPRLIWVHWAHRSFCWFHCALTHIAILGGFSGTSSGLN